MVSEMLINVRKRNPLVHNITNYVTSNDCANIILAAGGSPIMADDISEVEEITSISNALVLNTGTLNKGRLESMIKAGQKANSLNIPVVLDPVGAGVSSFRYDAVKELITKVRFSVIKGNASEIKLLALGVNMSRGVDSSNSSDSLDDILSFSKKLAKITGSVIAATGKIDIVTDGTKSFFIKNGTPYMVKITGTGCMLTSLIGSFIGANSSNILKACITAVGFMGLCGEKAYKKVCDRNEGTGSFKTYLIDTVSLMDEKTLQEGIRLESK